jgi:hypothetical protein
MKAYVRTRSSMHGVLIWWMNSKYRASLAAFFRPIHPARFHRRAPRSRRRQRDRSRNSRLPDCGTRLLRTALALVPNKRAIVARACPHRPAGCKHGSFQSPAQLSKRHLGHGTFASKKKRFVAKPAHSMVFQMCATRRSTSKLISAKHHQSSRACACAIRRPTTPSCSSAAASPGRNDEASDSRAVVYALPNICACAIHKSENARTAA